MLFALWLTLSSIPFGWTDSTFASSRTAASVHSPLVVRTSTHVYNWTPTHAQVWNFESKQALKQYADWGMREVVVYQPTDCTEYTVASWTIPSLNLQGQSTISGSFTRIPIDLPPYVDQFTLSITCDDSSFSTDWFRSSSLPIPTLYWKHSTRGSLETILHNGQQLSLHISIQGPDQNWQELIVLSASHPLETWTIPTLTTKRIRLTVMEEDRTVIERDIVPPHSWLEPATTVSSDKTIQFEMPKSVIATIHSTGGPLESLYFSRTKLEYTPTVEGLHWLEYQTVYGASLDYFWVYDGVWRWFSVPVWGASNTDSPLIVLEDFNEHSSIPFLRWDDVLLIEHRSWENGSIRSTSDWLTGDPYREISTPLLISPEDRLEYQLETLSLMASRITTTIDTPEGNNHSSRGLLRTDVQATDERLSSLLPFIFTPLTPDTAARILHHTALFWNPLYTRDLSWFKKSQDTANQALRLLEYLSDTDWDSLDIQTRLFIVWASLTADTEGLSPSSSFMRRNLDWLCSVQSLDTDDNPMLLSHVRWMVTQSYWKHRSCPQEDTISLSEHPFATSQINTITTRLNEAWEDKTLPRIPSNSPEWMHWILLEKEQLMKKRYVNLNLTLQSESVSDRGLFHEWQVRPIKRTLNDFNTWELSVKGVGRLYTSVWVPNSGSFAEIGSANLHVHRDLMTDTGKPLNPLNCEQGQSIQIRTQVQTTPHTPFCVRQWSAAGLANNHTPESHFCTISDANGQWHDTQHTYVLFDGRFRLPTTIVATEIELAHTRTIWFETRQYKELMPE